MDTILSAAANYGFPMVVSVYLLLRVEKKLDDLAGAINHLSTYLKNPVRQN